MCVCVRRSTSHTLTHVCMGVHTHVYVHAYF